MVLDGKSQYGAVLVQSRRASSTASGCDGTTVLKTVSELYIITYYLRNTGRRLWKAFDLVG
jgi:hypothetical protein